MIENFLLPRQDNNAHSAPERTSGGKKMKVKTRDLTLIGMLGALCCVLMYFSFAIPFMPPFMSFDFSGIVEIIGGFVMGPLQAVGIITVKLLLKLVTEGTSSAFTGEIQNFLLSCAYVLPAVLLYHRKKTKKNAIIGMSIGALTCSVTAIFTNLYLIIPFYMTMMGKDMDYFVKMCTGANPLIQDVVTMALIGILPFNLIKCGVNTVCTAVIYKRISPILHKYTESEESLIQKKKTPVGEE